MSVLDVLSEQKLRFRPFQLKAREYKRDKLHISTRSQITYKHNFSGLNKSPKESDAENEKDDFKQNENDKCTLVRGRQHT